MSQGFAPSRSNLGEQVFIYLRDQIYDIAIEPGTRLNLVDIANKLGVSRSPVRDALLLLVAEGLVEQIAGGGYQVIQFDQKLVRDVFVVRKALEPLALSQGIDNFDLSYIDEQLKFWSQLSLDNVTSDEFREMFVNADNELHRTIAVTSQNNLLREMLNKVIRLGVALRYWQHKQIVKPEEVTETIDEHIAVLQAIRAHDIDRATEALNFHIDGSLQRILSRFE